MSTIDRAREDGHHYGATAAEWAEIASDEDARSILEDIDPAVLDRYEPAAPLSGEWADDPTPRTLAREYGIDDETEDGQHELEAVCDAFEDAYYAAFSEGLQRAALARLGEDDETETA